jgi:hypothetical protein
VVKLLSTRGRAARAVKAANVAWGKIDFSNGGEFSRAFVQSDAAAAAAAATAAEVYQIHLDEVAPGGRCPDHGRATCVYPADATKAPFATDDQTSLPVPLTRGDVHFQFSFAVHVNTTGNVAGSGISDCYRTVLLVHEPFMRRIAVALGVPAIGIDCSDAGAWVETPNYLQNKGGVVDPEWVPSVLRSTMAHVERVKTHGGVFASASGSINDVLEAAAASGEFPDLDMSVVVKENHPTASVPWATRRRQFMKLLHMLLEQKLHHRHEAYERFMEASEKCDEEIADAVSTVMREHPEAAAAIMAAAGSGALATQLAERGVATELLSPFVNACAVIGSHLCIDRTHTLRQVTRAQIKDAAAGDFGARALTFGRLGYDGAPPLVLGEVIDRLRGRPWCIPSPHVDDLVRFSWTHTAGTCACERARAGR